MIGWFRGGGWLPNYPDSRDLLWSNSPKHPHERRSLEKYAPAVFQQGRTNSCVAQAIVNCLHIRETLDKGPRRMYSRLWIYYYSRHLHGATKRDRGTYIRTAMKSLQKYGVPPEKFWQFTRSKVNKQPGWIPTAHAHARRDCRYFRATVDQIPGLIAEGMPICFGMKIDKAFLKNRGPDIIDVPTGALIGGHAMAIVGWREVPGGKLQYRVRNSWGPRWRDGGSAWLTEECLRWEHAGDFTVIDGW